jgi:hypothetical protein
MNVTKHLLDGIKVMALFGAVALVVWSMPDSGVPQAGLTDAGDWQSITVPR